MATYNCVPPTEPASTDPLSGAVVIVPTSADEGVFADVRTCMALIYILSDGQTICGRSLNQPVPADQAYGSPETIAAAMMAAVGTSTIVTIIAMNIDPATKQLVPLKGWEGNILWVHGHPEVNISVAGVEVAGAFVTGGTLTLSDVTDATPLLVQSLSDIDGRYDYYP